MKLRFSFLWLFLAFGLSHGLQAQILDPVKWEMKSEHVQGNEFKLIFKAKIEEDWNIYSQFLESDEGPIATAFTFDESDHFGLIGKAEESDNRKEVYDRIFEMNVVKFFEYGIFTQKVIVSDDSKPVTGYLTFMTCDKKRCLPPKDVEFEFDLKVPSKQSEETTILSDKSSEETNKSIATTEDKSNEPNGKKDLSFNSSSSASDGAYGSDDREGFIEPVKWNADVKKISEQDFTITFIASIDEGWTIYSKDTDSEEGPIATSFTFDEADHFTYEEVKESGKFKKGPDPYFDGAIVVKILAPEASFTIPFVVTDLTKPVTGYYTFMACDKSTCLPPSDVDYWIDPSSETVLLGKEAMAKINGLSGAGPGLEGNVIDQVVTSIQETYKSPIGDCGKEDVAKNKSWLWTFILGFLGGLVALLTPCVFPMIPLTVSFFTKGSKDRKSGLRNGLLYGFSIIVIYVAIGLLITAFLGPTALNELSTNWIANTLFFVVFIVFAFSFFGFYEITLPSSWANKSDAMADKGGLVGIFFMAFTLALVSFSCTGPIIGSAIVQSATDKMGPFIVMLGFSTALALPFGLFAAFPAWLNSLPKSGSWMNTVKVVLGFLELALALKFLSVADMTMHWGILGYEVYMGLWVLIFAGMTAYLFGLIRFPHDSPSRKLSIPRTAFALFFLGCTVYLASGFMFNEKTNTYCSLKAMSGLAPPAHYNYFLPEPQLDNAVKDRYASYTKCANNLDCFKDYYEGLAYAKEVNKPILLDFTGYGCVNCRKTEEHIWVADKVWEKINTEFVLVSLYVDDRKELENVLISKSTQGKLRNVGNKWADFQIVNFEQNSQPLYVMMTPDEKVIAKPRGYKEGVTDYADFLECGLQTYNSYTNDNESLGLNQNQ